MDIGKYYGRAIAICLLVVFSVFFIPSSPYSFPYKGLDISIRGTIGEMYDDNFEFSSVNKMEDFITKLTFNLDVKYEGKIRTMYLNSSINQSIFAKHHNESDTSGVLGLNFQNEFSEYDRIKLDNIFTMVFEPGSFEDEFGRTRGRARTSQNVFNFIYERDMSEQLAVIARYSNILSEVSGENGETSYQNNLGLVANYIYSAATVLFLSYEFATDKFKSGGDYSTHKIFTGVRRYITKQLYFDGIGGVDFIKSTLQDKEIADIREYVTVSLVKEFKNTTARASFEKKIDSNIYGKGLFDSWKTSVAFTMQLSKRLNCSFSGFYGQGTFESSNVTEKLLGTDIGFTYDFSENLKGNLGYTHSDKTSTNLTEIPEYTRNTILSGVTVVF